MSVMTPHETVQELDKHIIGQQAAKRAVAIALRNRHRRMQLPLPLRNEISPKNILMIGPTGVGKTEIARRLAKLANAPFIKVEATKFTEVGYVGRDVESIIRDLADMAVKMTKEAAIQKIETQAALQAEKRILEALKQKEEKKEKQEKNPENTETLFDNLDTEVENSEITDAPDNIHQWETNKTKLLAGELDNTEIEIEVASMTMGVEIMAPPGMEDMSNQLQGIFQNLYGGKTKTRKMRVIDALKLLKEEEAAKLINEDDLKTKAIQAVEQNGIVFLDEIDKITQRSEYSGADVSREGVQRDLLPLVEGCTVSTKYGMIKTDHILFIASGAFHMSKPSDLIPELQGRLPIRVTLDALSVEDFEQILTQTDACLTKQYIALLGTENVTLNFQSTSIRKLAEIAFEVNESTENIGARRLHTLMEKLLEKISYEATEKTGEKIEITPAYVDAELSILVKNQDLSRFIL